MSSNGIAELGSNFIVTGMQLKTNNNNFTIRSIIGNDWVERLNYTSWTQTVPQV